MYSVCWSSFFTPSHGLAMQHSFKSLFWREVINLSRKVSRAQTNTCVHIRKEQCDEDVRKSRNRNSERKSLHPGHVVQAHTSDDYSSMLLENQVFLIRSSEENGIRTFWKIQGLYGVSNSPVVYDHVSPMRRVDVGLRFEQVFTETVGMSAKFILKIGPHTRRVLCLHDCLDENLETSCSFNRNNGVIFHDEDYNNASLFC